MAVPILQAAFIAGEVSPALYGRYDLARNHLALSTARNGFIGYQGGFYSRAGTKFVGYSKQTGRQFPPRLIPFGFSISQGLALEFGNFYMRVISEGAFVVEDAIALTGATQANPCVISATSLGCTSATPNNGAVTASYAPGDLVTLAGGTDIRPAVLDVSTTELLSLALDSPGGAPYPSPTVYAPGDTIDLAGGVQTTQAVVTVTHTQVVSAVVAAGGSGSSGGTHTVTGTTGTGTKFQAQVTCNSSGVMISVDAITVAGDYTVNPTVPANEPVTGGALIGAQLRLSIGVLAFTISNAGVFNANPTGGTFTQAASSGSGTQATFKTAILGPHALTVSDKGAYSAFPANPVAQASTTGVGLGCTFTCTHAPSPFFSNGDWVYLAGLGGMTELNGGIYVVAGVVGSTFQLHDVFANTIDSTAFTAYTGGGTAARIFTLTTPYAEEDLKYLKSTQSADVLSLCCVNQETAVEYPPQDLQRLSDNNWVLSPLAIGSSIAAPALGSGSASAAGSVDYAYGVTAVGSDGSESVVSPTIRVDSAVDITSTAGSITMTWPPVDGARQYYVYKAAPGYGVEPPVGALFGFAGQTYATQLIDSNIVADFSQVPPLHKDPFARGAVVDAVPTNVGSGYTTITLTINTVTGSGAELEGLLVGGELVAILVINAGQNYQSGDTISISGDGSAAAADLVVGAETGTYPSVVNYFQERRAYANSLNQPDTYWMSQPGAFVNFDWRLPTIASDAITGSPWSLQVNGIQFMVPTAGGLLVFTGLANWLLVGTGSFATNVQPITPSSQVATPQPENGCSPTVPPIKINYDVLYVNSKGSFYFDQPYQLYALSEPVDITENSAHLFINYSIREHAWCQQPYKIVWATRDDGVMLSLTWLKQQQVAAWARHDTRGKYVSVCSITEPPVDALYIASQRSFGGNDSYMIERMDDRKWKATEECWCVDCGLSLPQPTPAATITASSATGLGAVTGVSGLVGGANYSAATYAQVDDNAGTGSGAVPTLTIVAGVITAVTFPVGLQGTNYGNPAITFYDPENLGSGASATAVLDNSANFSTDADVFSAGDVGSVIRMGGGVAEVTTYTNPRLVVANILSPITVVVPNSGQTPQRQTSGNWTLTKPVTNITGLRHLANTYVTGLADGIVVPPTLVAADGTLSVPLATPASAIILGVPFRVQAQSLYLDGGAPTIQGQRKKVADVVARLQASLGVKIGSNQPDGATQNPIAVDLNWSGLATVPDDGPNFPLKPFNAMATPLRTGDTQKIPVQGGYGSPGQVALQQDNPLPMEILAIISDALPGDTPQTKAPKPQGNGR